MRPLPVFAWPLLCAVLLVPRAGLAAEMPAYQLHLGADLAALAIAGSLSSAWLLKGSLAGPYCAPMCDRADLPSIDRGAAGNYSTSWRTVSDVGVASVIVGSAAVLLIDEGVSNGANDLIVVAQAELFSNALAILSNMGTRRPRPFAYGDSAPLADRQDGNAALSFFSGHTAGTVAVTVATFTTLRRLDRPVLPWVYLSVAGLASGLVGASRVVAGDHFPTDVIVGAVVGVANGVLAPQLHDTPVRLVPIAFAAGARSMTGISVAGAF